MIANDTALKLKEFTKSSHQQLEKVMVSEIKQIISIDHYIKLLSTFYGYFAGLELAIAKYINEHNLPDFADRRKSDLIRDDLNKLGAPVPAIAPGNNLPTITNALQAFGALYVMEGSTIGGKFIAKMIAQQLQNPNFEAVDFFKGYGELTGQMWDKFKDALNKLAKDETESQVILTTGDETFSKFEAWFLRQS